MVAQSPVVHARFKEGVVEAKKHFHNFFLKQAGLIIMRLYLYIFDVYNRTQPTTITWGGGLSKIYKGLRATY